MSLCYLRDFSKDYRGSGSTTLDKSRIVSLNKKLLMLKCPLKVVGYITQELDSPFLWFVIGLNRMQWQPCKNLVMYIWVAAVFCVHIVWWSEGFEGIKSRRCCTLHVLCILAWILDPGERDSVNNTMAFVFC